MSHTGREEAIPLPAGRLLINCSVRAARVSGMAPLRVPDLFSTLVDSPAITQYTFVYIYGPLMGLDQKHLCPSGQQIS